ncbi:MAG: BON domain-containing protein [Chloroflexi bacterium]|nr:BON domain-containing protein [Chloroflexota bacterium]
MTELETVCAQAQRRIKLDKRLHEEGVAVHVECRPDGVCLTGSVARLAQRYYAEEDVRLTAGEASLPLVDDLMIGPERPDGEVRDKVIRTLVADPHIDETAITVEVQNGVVTLRGMVDSITRKRLPGALCWWIPGVRDVRNGLTVLYPEDDGEDLLAEAVELVLDKDPLVDDSGITVITHDGLVHLTGTVTSEIARDAAEQDAWSVLGTRRVQNDLEIAPPPSPLSETPPPASLR